MPDPKRPLKVFLCHAHADRDPVRGLYTRLTQDGVDAWLDKAKLLPGQDWELEIRKAVREADVVVVCLSKQFNQAGFRQKEVRLALDTAMEKPEGEIFIIPARLEECDNLESLRRWHWVDLFEDDGYEMLVRALRARADRIGATLQLKKSWLPNISSPQQSQKDNLQYQKISQVENHRPTSEVKKPKQKLTVKKLFGNTVLAFWGIFVFVAIFLAWKPFFQKAELTPEDKPSQIIGTITSTETIESSATLTSRSTSTPANTLIPILLPTEITDAKGVSMVLVPAGSFIIGSNADDAWAECQNSHGANYYGCGKGEYLDEEPPHKVDLDAFYMDKYEVTNELYKNCVLAEICSLPSDKGRYNTSFYNNYPIVFVSWNQAKTYCEWRNGKLPTEAEWEKAARGTDGRTYPWGQKLDCSFANFGLCTNDIAIVGSYVTNKSPYGVFNMAGNVREWVADWYDENYYTNVGENENNPQGPLSGIYRVVRGGSWRLSEHYVRSANRQFSPPDISDVYTGFRCAVDANP